MSLLTTIINIKNSTKMKKIFFFAAAIMAAVSVNAETVFDWANNVGTIEATGTTELSSKVKIHTNTDEVPAIRFANGYSIDTTQTPAVHANYVELSVDGGFKAGDVVKVEFCYNNKDPKVAVVGIYNLEGKEIAASGEGANARLTDETSTFNYALTEDMAKIRLARAKSGKTGTFIISLVVVRGEVVEVKALNPQFSALPGKYFDPFKLGISSSEEGAKVFCRLGGEGDFAEFKDSIEINDYDKTYVVEAFATKEGALNSDTVKGEFKLEHFIARPVFNAKKVYTFYNLKEEDIQFVSEGNGEKTTYTMDGKPCPSVNYKHLAGSDSPDSVLITTTKGQEEVTFRYKNGSDKNNVIKCAENFMQMDSKNFEIWVDSVKSGDTIVFVVTAKGSAPQFDVAYSTASYLEAYMPEDDTDPCFTDGLVMTASDARVDENYIGWQDLVYVVAEGGHSRVRIKETANGFRIAKILVGAYRGEAPADQAIENVNTTVKAVKVFENGQLVIIKNGVRYNALGAQL